MLTSLKFTGTQVLVLFILMGVGYVAAKKKWLSEDGIRSVTNLMLYIITPCMMISAFQRPFDPALLKGFLISAAASVGVYVMEIAIASLLIRDRDEARRRTLRFGVVFANCGYMAFPLLDALMGSEAVLYGAAFNAVHVVFLWTYGLSLMCGGKEKISVRKAVINPGTVSAVIGLVLFFCSIELPPLLGQPVEYLAGLNAPVPMLIIGYYLAKLDFHKVLRTGNEYLMLALRLVGIPLLTLGILYLCGVRGFVLTSIVVCVSAPVATMATMFATKYELDPEFASSTVAVSTLISIVTMTLIVGFTGFIS